ncbi:DUF4158 domain-containing protein [Streptomyces sp. M19]
MEYAAGLVKVPTAELAKYDLAGAKRHRKQIREALGFRPATLEDEEQLTTWLATEVCPVELVEDRQREALLVECRARSIEPPGRTRVEKVLVGARNRWERVFCARAIERLGRSGGPAAGAGRGGQRGRRRAAGAAQAGPWRGRPGLLLTEVNKLNDVRRLGLPEGLFADCLRSWWPRGGRGRSRCTPRTSATPPRTYGSRCSRRCAPPGRRRSPMPWGPADRSGAEDQRPCRAAGRAAADGRVEEGPWQGEHPLQARRRGDRPAGRDGARGAVPGGREKTLRDLVAEAKANEKVFKAKVRTTLRSSYSAYYRQMLPPLLRTLGFRCNNTAYRPVMEALALLEKYADVDGETRFYDAAEAVPMDGVVRKDWREAVVDNKGKVERIPYELCVLVALRDAIRRREIYIEGAARWRNPAEAGETERAHRPPGAQGRGGTPLGRARSP